MKFRSRSTGKLSQSGDAYMGVSEIGDPNIVP